MKRIVASVCHGALAIALCVFIAGCEDSPSSPSPVNGLALFVEVEPTTIPAGGSGFVAVYLRNVGNSPSTITLSSGCVSLIRIFRHPGNEAVPVTVACAAVVVPLTIAPGEAYNQSLPIGSGQAPNGGMAVAPGEYYAVGSSEHSDIPTIRSERVRFTVR